MDFSEFKRKVLARHSDIVKELAFISAKIIKDRSLEVKNWLTTSISELSQMIVRIEEFLVKKTNMDRIQS